MEIKLAARILSVAETDALVLIESEGAKRADLAGPLAVLYESGEISGKPLELTLLHGVAGFKARRVLIVGAGKPEKFDAALVRKIAAAAVRFLKGKGVKSAVLALEGAHATAANVSAAAIGLVTGAWEPDVHKTEKKDSDKAIDTFAISAALPEVSAAIGYGAIIGEALNLSRASPSSRPIF